MDVPAHQPVQTSPEIVQIDDSDEETQEEMAEASKIEPTEDPIPQPEQCIDHSDGVQEIL